MKINDVDVSKLPADVRKQFKTLQVMYAEKKIQNRAKKDFLSFVKCVWPEFVEGAHHRHIAKKFNDLANGKINRLIVNMPPRHTKSEFASFLLPAWMVGLNPKLKIIQATHTGELAVRFGRKARSSRASRISGIPPRNLLLLRKVFCKGADTLNKVPRTAARVGTT